MLSGAGEALVSVKYQRLLSSHLSRLLTAVSGLLNGIGGSTS